MDFLDNYTYQLELINSIRGGKIALWGAGRAALKVCELLKTDGHNVACFIDNNPEKQGGYLKNLPIVSKTDCIINEVKFIIVTPRGIGKAILKDIQLIKPAMTFDCYYFLQHSSEFKILYDNLFKDNRSKEILKQIALANINGDNHYYAQINEPNQYYCIAEFMQKKNEYLAEVGAFVGDSLERFIWLNQEFKKIYAFEPAKRQFKALKYRIKRLNNEWALEDEQIIAINIGIGEFPQKVKINKSVGFSNYNIQKTGVNNFNILDLTSIDDYFKDKHISFLKADIEGDEMFMLKGANEVIKKQMPKIAICTYHNISDLIEIVNYILKLVPKKYKFALRHHSNNFTETVLYCWT